MWPDNPDPGPALASGEGGVVPGPIFLESEDLFKEFEILQPRVSRSWRPNQCPIPSRSASRPSIPTVTGLSFVSGRPADAATADRT